MRVSYPSFQTLKSKKMSNNKTANLSTVNGFSSVLKNYEKSIAQLLHTKYGISVDEFYVTCVNAVKKNPKLLQCDPKSLFGAILLSAEVGLRPNTPEQHSFIIPYKGEAKFQIGYQGLLEMMYRNPRVKTVNAEAVFENDTFDYGYGLEPFLIHKPFRGGDRGKLVCTYAVVKLNDADPIFTVVAKAELDKIKSFSQSAMGDNAKYSPYNNGTDVHNFMEKKAAIKKLAKLIPKASVIEFSKAINYDSRFEGGAKVRVAIPENPDEIVQPELIDESAKKSLESAFDDDFELIEENDNLETEQLEVSESEISVFEKSDDDTIEESSFLKEIDFGSLPNEDESSIF